MNVTGCDAAFLAKPATRSRCGMLGLADVTARRRALRLTTIYRGMAFRPRRDGGRQLTAVPNNPDENPPTLLRDPELQFVWGRDPWWRDGRRVEQFVSASSDGFTPSSWPSSRWSPPSCRVGCGAGNRQARF